MDRHKQCRVLFGELRKSILWAFEVEGNDDEECPLPHLPEGCVSFIIPLNGALTWQEDGEERKLDAGMALLTRRKPKSSPLGMNCEGRAIVIGIRHETLVTMLEPFRPGLFTSMRDLVFGTAVEAELQVHHEILSQVIPALCSPIVSGSARAFWYESQFKALLALLCFVPAEGKDEFFCSRQKRLARVRVGKAKSILETRIDEVFDLNRLASDVGCSPSYLSRTFSTTVGITLSQYLRKRRIERAAEMLVTGNYNVSEAAIEVGYQSLSHFSKAFQQVKGCLPSKYEVEAA